MIDDIYMLSDTEITRRVAARLKKLRLQQNLSRQDMAASSGVSVSSIARMEDGEIKSFDSFLRILRTLGSIDLFAPLLQEEEPSPGEYYKMMHAAKTKPRRRASRSSNSNRQEDSEW